MKMKNYDKYFELDLYGFCIIKNVLNNEEVKEIRKLNCEYIEKFGNLHQGKTKFRKYSTTLPDAKTVLIPNLITINKKYFKFIDHPKVLNIIEKIMGDKLILGSLNARIVRPGDGQQNLHSDIPERLHKIGSPVMMNALWLLDDFTLENGATYIIPGSHKIALSKLIPGKTPNLVQRLIANAGSVLIFNGQCWHGSGENNSNNDRHALFSHYRISDWMLFQNHNFEKFPKSWIKDLNNKQKDLLRITDKLPINIYSDQK